VLLTSALDGSKRSASRCGRFTPGKVPSTHCIGVLAGRRDGFDAMAKRNKSLRCQELNAGHPFHSSVTILTELPLIAVYYVGAQRLHGSSPTRSVCVQHVDFRLMDSHRVLYAKQVPDTSQPSETATDLICIRYQCALVCKQCSVDRVWLKIC
jgi:hypothetical protein